MTDTPTLGRAASLRVAYASACQDVAMLREENAKLAERLAWSEANALKWERMARESAEICADITKCYVAERDTATAHADAAEAELAQLKQRTHWLEELVVRAALVRQHIIVGDDRSVAYPDSLGMYVAVLAYDAYLKQASDEARAQKGEASHD